MFGFVNCNKPIGFSSRDAVNVIQGRLKGRRIKVGHCGTLDPLADGVLVIGVGPAAKLVPYVHETSKTYEGTFRLAAESPTGDLEMEPTIYEDHPLPSIQQLREACQALTGIISQTPPAYSAIQVNGQRLYDLARKGRDVKVPSRKVQIDSIEIQAYQYPEIKLKIVCGTGTYIRTLGMDLAKAVGTRAVMTALTRTAVGEFQLADSVSIETIREQDVTGLLVPATTGVAHLSRITVDAEDCTRLQNGVCLLGEREIQPDENAPATIAVTEEGHLKAILVPKQGSWFPKKVFPPHLQGNPSA